MTACGGPLEVSGGIAAGKGSLIGAEGNPNGTGLGSFSSGNDFDAGTDHPFEEFVSLRGAERRSPAMAGREPRPPRHGGASPLRRSQ